MSKWSVIRRATKEDLDPYREFIGDDKVVGAWVLKSGHLVIEYGMGDTYMVYRNGRYEGFAKKDEELGRDIKLFELTSGLKGSAKDTWEDILSN